MYMFEKLKIYLRGDTRDPFTRRVDDEIYCRIFPHLRGEKDSGYSFTTVEEMDAETDELSMEALLETIEHHAAHMGKSYGTAFRLIVYRELNEQLKQFANLAKRRDFSKRKIDQKFVAVHAET